MDRNETEGLTRIGRRGALKVGVGGAAAAMFGGGLLARPAGAASAAVTKWKDALRVPAVLPTARRYRITSRQKKLQVHSDIGPITKLWAYGTPEVGYTVPGPTFRVEAGSAPKIVWRNRLSKNPDKRHLLRMDPRIYAPPDEGGVHGAVDNRAGIVHIHGLKTVEGGDGWPENRFKPGSKRLDKHPNLDHSGGTTLWYHDHNLGTTAINVMMGLAGFFFIEDEHERTLISDGKLPLRMHEIPLMILDRRVGADGQIDYEYFHDDHFFGDVPLVNGTAYPHLEVEARKYRMRIVNACNSRVLRMRLGDGTPTMYVIGSDQGFVHSPTPVNDLVLSPGERADVVIDFAQFTPGDDIILENTWTCEHCVNYPLPELMQFRVKSNPTGDPVVLPAVLPSQAEIDKFNAYDVGSAVGTREFELEDEPHPLGSKWLLAGGGWLDDFEPDGVTRAAAVQIKNGDVEIWDWVNKTDGPHPMHPHLASFKVIGRWIADYDSDGNVVPGQALPVHPHETGWKDTVLVGALELVRTLVRFKGYANLASGQKEAFPYHCHVLEHEDHEMMRFFELEY